MSNKDVINKAKSFCEENNINDYPVDIVNLCERFGIKVCEEFLRKDVSGFIVCQKDNFRDYGSNKVIVVNSFDRVTRRRFTVAHELAHYVLHRGNNELYAHRNVGQNNGVEHDANIFASIILMPEFSVHNCLSRLEERWGALPFYTRVQYIAEKFDVSLAAAEVRLDQLGIS